MAWITVATLAGLGDATAAALINNGQSQTRAAIAAIFGPSVAEQMAKDQTIKDAAVAAMSDAAVQAQLNYYKGASPLATTTDLDTLGSGIYTVWSASAATTLGLPGAAGGVLVVHRFGTETGIMAYHTGGIPVRTFTRYRGSTGWAAEWTEDPGTELVAQMVADAVAAAPKSASGFKNIPLALTLGTGGANAALTANTRFPMRYSAPVTRWRVHISNVNPRFGLVRGAADFTGLWYGAHAGNGAFTAAPTQISGAFSLAADGTEWVSPWVSHPLGGGAEYLLSFGYTAAAAPWALVGGSWTNATASNASVTAPTMTRSATAPFNVWVEAETYATTPVIAAFGDSLTAGVGATLPIHESPVSVYARDRGALPVHYAASGESMGSSVDGAAMKWVRWADLDKADAVLLAMGSNDVFAGATLADLQSLHAQMVTLLEKHVSPVVYGATITPRTSVTGAAEDVRRTYNTWLATLPNGTRDLFDFAAAVSSDNEALTPAYDADGIHLTTAGYAAERAAISRPIVSLDVDSGLVSDSGVRNISSLWDAGSTGGVVHLRRVANTVFLNVYGVTMTGTASVLTLPVGFRPDHHRLIPSVSYPGGSGNRATLSSTSGVVQLLGYTGGVAQYLTLSWPTSDAWPSVLPGVAV